MKSIALVILFGMLFVASSSAQEKSDKNCSSSGISKTTMNTTCNESDEVSISSIDDNKQIVSNQTDDKNKRVGKDTKTTDKNINTDKSKSSSSDDGCCTTDRKKTEKTKSPKS